MANPVQSLQNANPAISTVSRQPQTTPTPVTGSAPFVRSSRKSSIQGYISSGNAWGGSINLPLKAAGGYLRGLRIKLVASGGTGTAAVAAADAPWNAIQSILFKDPSGTPVVQVDGFGLYEIMRYSGQFGMAGFQDPASIPSYSAMTVAGNFTISFYLPLELDSSGYCSMPLMNASALPTLQINLAAAATVYSTQPTGATTVAVQVDEDYWAAPINQPDLGPPDVGSSAQWSQSQAPQGVPSASYARLNSQRTGTLIHTIIAVLRDSTGARVAGFPTSDLQFSLDGVPVTYELLSEHKDKQYEQFGLTPETGVLVWSFRDSVQSLVGSADTHDCLLSTTPATLLEVVGTWGTISNAPGTLQLYTGELWPVSGIPYTHLAQ